MKQSIFKKTIQDKTLGQISPYQKAILESYNLDKDIFALKLTDPATGKVHWFSKWVSPTHESTVYEYMKKKNLSIEDLEKMHIRIQSSNSIYDPKKERLKKGI